MVYCPFPRGLLSPAPVCRPPRCPVCPSRLLVCWPVWLVCCCLGHLQTPNSKLHTSLAALPSSSSTPLHSTLLDAVRHAVHRAHHGLHGRAGRCSAALAAAIMFSAFSFDHRPPAQHEAERAAMHLSPTSMPPDSFAKSPSPPPSVDRLAHMLDCHSLHVEVDPAYESPAPDHDDPASSSASLAAKAHRPSTYSRAATAALRKKRQSNARKHCSSSHLKDVSDLVERMVEHEDQCHVAEPRSPPLLPASPGADPDEGVDMDHNPDDLLFTLPFRRSGDNVNRCAAVTKRVRMRRLPKMLPKKKKSSSK